MMSGRRLVACAAALVLVGLATAGCGGGGATSYPTAATRPATKATCPAPSLPADSGFELVDRTLVGFGPTTLGVEEAYERDGATMEVVSGGYFDEVTEAFDTLEIVGKASVRGGDADVLAGPYQDSTVHIALWREPGIEVPCDAHAIIVTGVTEQQFFNMLTTLS